MRPTPIPDADVWSGSRRAIYSAPDGDLTRTDVAPVEALVECSGPDGHLISVRCIPEADDVDQLAAGGALWLTFHGALVPFELDVRAASEPPPTAQAPQDAPGYQGSLGPFRRQYQLPHVYARDVHSGAGNCVCGQGLGHARHLQAAPGVPIPARLRR